MPQVWGQTELQGGRKKMGWGCGPVIEHWERTKLFSACHMLHAHKAYAHIYKNVKKKQKRYEFKCLL